MKKAIGLSLTLIILLLSAISCFAVEYSCTLKPNVSNVKAGEIVSVDVNVSEGLSGIDVIITYDTEKYEFIQGATSSLMTVFSNEAQAGSIHIAAVSTEATEAGAIYNFKLRVLGSGGEIKTHVKEALDANDNDVSSLISDTQIKIKATGRYTPQSVSGPLPTTSPDTNAGETAASPDSQTRSGNAGGGNNSADVTGENASVTEADAQSDEAASEADSTTTVILSRDDPEARKGLVISLVVAVLTVSMIVAILLVKRFKKSKNNAENGEQKTDEN